MRLINISSGCDLLLSVPYVPSCCLGFTHIPFNLAFGLGEQKVTISEADGH
ncbi:hypothetical protein QWZ16_13800 [Vibrio ostreicida]|uniref:Uncharacterized protein n=1 Tax=Vibrio ostreicida TaxID=526588 RepID=A0ABT8BXE2_9VIBR|nr:hypothetical protein [Vibrio ostreicida]MDN3610775.1 hypothetical protein [Vibrio ostreicida]